MNFLEMAEKRYSVRRYSDKKVETEKLEKILHAAHVAPTAVNLQPVRLLSNGRIQALSWSAQTMIASGAP